MNPLLSRRAALVSAAGVTAAAATAGRAIAAPTTPLSPPTANGQLYKIGLGKHKAVIAGVAATLLSWTVDGQEMLLTHSPDDVSEGYRGKTILPWPNRIDHGAYTFDGKNLQVPINEPKHNAALHGLMSFVEWQPVRHTADSVQLSYVLPPQYGYPFRLAFDIEFTVDDSGVRSTLTARNIGDTAAPFGTANHTYLAAGPTGKIDDITLTIPADTYYTVNDNLIPTGTASVAGTDYDFRTPRRLGDTQMDTAFTGVAHRDGSAVVRFDRPDRSVELWVDDTHHYLQAYTDDSPDTNRPTRQGITVEPMTCAPNAFVTGDGLITLQPGEQHTGTFGWRVVS